MRLIDADALTEKIKGECIMPEWCYSLVLTAIGDTPTAAEVKHGAWIPHPNADYREWDVCTACGTGFRRREYGVENGREWVEELGCPYCPNCGARMDKDE